MRHLDHHYPDNPQLVLPEFLARLDGEVMGRWLGQPKLDGYRRVAEYANGMWSLRSKRREAVGQRLLPDCLWTEFQLLPWPDGIILDMEWVGPRQGLPPAEHTLHVFDLLGYAGEWLGHVGFRDRYTVLQLIMGECCCARVRQVPCFSNPALVAMYARQAPPFSEGLVVRRADSGLVGHPGRAVDNPEWFKVKHGIVHHAEAQRA